MIAKVHSTFCVRCDKVFDKDVPRHAKNMCQYCYTYTWTKAKMDIQDKTPKSTHCKTCNISFTDGLHKNGKPAVRASKGLCKKCYNKVATRFCEKCGANKGKRGHGFCSLCRIQSGKWKRKTVLPTKVNKTNMDLIRSVLMRYKMGANTMVDPFIVADLYLTIFTGGESGYKNPVGMDIDTFDESAQVIAMLKLLKMTYDKNK